MTNTIETTPGMPLNVERASSAEEAMPRVTPPVDIYESKDELLVVADLPGVHRKSLQIELRDGVLLIEGRQSSEGAAASAPNGDRTQPCLFTRSFRVPSAVDPNGIEADLSLGVLKIHMQKSEAAKPRQISVRAE